MTQISRPFQIALAVLVLFVAVWFVALRGHSSSGESSGSAASSSAPAATPQPAAGSSAGSSGNSSSSSSTSHASAPGVAGLTRAIAKARGAVAQSEQQADRLQHKSEQASGSASAPSSASGSSGAAHAKSAAPSAAAKTHAAAPAAGAHAKGAAPGTGTHAKNGAPAMQLQVEHQLEQGKVVAILFWNPKGSVDAVVRRELQAAKSAQHGRLAIHVALSGQVGSFGTFTRTVQVYGTPTVLLVNSKGATSTVTGLADAFALDQAIKEVKQAH
jgi:hypothetical protein